MKDSCKKFSCEFPGCDKSFNRRDYLERHAVNHLSVKPFVCEQCKRQFSRKDLYDNHMNTRFHAKRLEELAKTQVASSGSSSSREPSQGAVSPQFAQENTGAASRYNSGSPLFTPAAPELNEPLLPLTGHGGYNNSQPTFLPEQESWNDTLTSSAFAAGEWGAQGPLPPVSASQSEQGAEWRRDSLSSLNKGIPGDNIIENSVMPADSVAIPQNMTFGFPPLGGEPLGGEPFASSMSGSQRQVSEPSLIEDEWNADLVDSATNQPQTPSDFFDFDQRLPAEIDDFGLNAYGNTLPKAHSLFADEIMV